MVLFTIIIQSNWSIKAIINSIFEKQSTINCWGLSKFNKKIKRSKFLRDKICQLWVKSIKALEKRIIFNFRVDPLLNNPRSKATILKLVRQKSFQLKALFQKALYWVTATKQIGVYQDNIHKNYGFQSLKNLQVKNQQGLRLHQPNLLKYKL